MKIDQLNPNHPWVLIKICVLLLLAVAACAPNPPVSESGNRLEPADGAYLGVNLDWSRITPADFNAALGHRAAVFVQFYQFPLDDTDFANLDAAVESVKSENGMLMLTLEPWGGLEAVTPQAVGSLVEKLAEYNKLGTSIFIRFAHEMNGSWYPWSQQPSAYIQAFRMFADAVHQDAPRTAMLWAPNYGGGYPFTGGPFEAQPADADFTLLDTNQDGRLNMADDPYSPYYPGDDAVDWVGMTIYHWDNEYPWGENEIPEADKFIQQLTGNFNGQNGDDTALPDFYEVFHTTHGKPMAIPETAALYNTARSGGPTELEIKQSWWRQVLNADLLAAYPGIKMINWFEWEKPENEIAGEVIDWRALGSPEVASQFISDLPLDHLIFAP